MSYNKSGSVERSEGVSALSKDKSKLVTNLKESTKTNRKEGLPRIGVVDFFCGAGGVSVGLKAVTCPAMFEIIEGIDNN